MQFRNYAAQACRDLTRYIEFAGDPGGDSDTESFAGLVKRIEEAVHFALPDFGRIFDDSYKGLFDTELRLPYPCVTLEYTVADDDGVDKSTTLHSPKRLILALEVDRNLPCGPGGLGWLGAGARDRVLDALSDSESHPDGKGILVWGASSMPWESGSSELFFSPEMCMWLLPQSYPGEDDIEMDRVKVIGKGRQKSAKHHSGVILGMGILAVDRVVEMALTTDKFGARNLQEVLDHMSTDIAQEAAVVLEFIEASSCTNIHDVVGQSGPKPSAAAKRKREGKMPIFETRVLALDLPGKASGAPGERQGLGDSGRNSPRQHLRRGHIRKLESGKRIWVQSAVIGAGSQGVINKNYLINKRS